jgi:hypothetical protein
MYTIAKLEVASDPKPAYISVGRWSKPPRRQEAKPLIKMFSTHMLMCGQVIVAWSFLDAVGTVVDSNTRPCGPWLLEPLRKGWQVALMACLLPHGRITLLSLHLLRAEARSCCQSHQRPYCGQHRRS